MSYRPSGFPILCYFDSRTDFILFRALDFSIPRQFVFRIFGQLTKSYYALWFFRTKGTSKFRHFGLLISTFGLFDLIFISAFGHLIKRQTFVHIVPMSFRPLFFSIPKHYDSSTFEHFTKSFRLSDSLNLRHSYIRIFLLGHFDSRMFSIFFVISAFGLFS